ncbi:MAG: EVE domain-containing protein [Xanthomonadaceae bacterium]|nr:EVE domain-containing protein [Xanthomonadaceae bacterium]
MQRWLMKTEPGAFSIADLARKRREPWDGVRNYQARNYLRAMRKGDGVLVYHSNCAVPGVVGIAKVARAAYPDPTQFDPKHLHFDPASRRDDPRWSLVDVAYVRTLKRNIALDELKGRPELAGLALIQRGNRLSVLPVSAAQWDFILGLERGGAHHESR